MSRHRKQRRDIRRLVAVLSEQEHDGWQGTLRGGPCNGERAPLTYGLECIRISPCRNFGHVYRRRPDATVFQYIETRSRSEQRRLNELAQLQRN